MARPKNPHGKIVRTTISIPEETDEKWKRNAKRRGFQNSHSAYIAWLIERDCEGGVQREEISKDDES